LSDMPELRIWFISAYVFYSSEQTHWKHLRFNPRRWDESSHKA